MRSSIRRTRSKGGFTKSDVIRIDADPGGSPSSETILNSLPLEAVGEVSTMNDGVAVNYHKRIKQGETIMQDFDVVTDRRDCVSSHWYFGDHPTWGSRTLSGPIAYFYSIPQNIPSYFTGDMEKAKSIILIKAYDKMNSIDMQSMVTGMELAKTGEMLKSPFEGVRDLVDKIAAKKKKLLKKGLDSAQAFAGAWLEYRYGWFPLMMDVSNAVDVIETAKVEHSLKPRYLVSRSGIPLEYNTRGNDTFSIVGVTVDRSWNQSYKFLASAGVRYTLYDKNKTASMQRSLGLHLRDIPMAVWELVPFSFVMDWFVDVGGWLNAVMPNPGVKVLGNWVNHKLEVQCNTILGNAWIKPATTPLTLYQQKTGGSFLNKTLYQKRTTNLSIFDSSPVTPGRLTVPQSIDSAALLFGAASGKMEKLRL